MGRGRVQQEQALKYGTGESGVPGDAGTVAAIHILSHLTSPEQVRHRARPHTSVLLI